MKRIVNIGLFLSFLFCYLEWPTNNSAFIFQGEYEIFTNSKKWISNFTHPLILLGLIAQIILVFAIINPKINTKLNHFAVLILTPIVVLFFAVGLLSFNVKIMVSTLPFMGLVVYYFILSKRKRTQ